MNDYILAWALLLAPETERLRPIYYPVHCLREIAVAQELLDEAFAPMHFMQPEHYEGSLANLRAMYHVSKDWPPLRDAQLFPTYETIIENIEFNQAHQDWLENQMILYEGVASQTDYYCRWLDKTQDLGNMWSWLATIKDPFDRDIFNKRGSLDSLRDYLKPAQYYRGVLPPAVPIERFQRIH